MQKLTTIIQTNRTSDDICIQNVLHTAGGSVRIRLYTMAALKLLQRPNDVPDPADIETSCLPTDCCEKFL